MDEKRHPFAEEGREMRLRVAYLGVAICILLALAGTVLAKSQDCCDKRGAAGSESKSDVRTAPGSS